MPAQHRSFKAVALIAACTGALALSACGIDGQLSANSTTTPSTAPATTAASSTATEPTLSTPAAAPASTDPTFTAPITTPTVSASPAA